MKNDRSDDILELRRLLEQERAAKLRAVGRAMRLQSEVEAAHRESEAARRESEAARRESEAARRESEAAHRESAAVERDLNAKLEAVERDLNAQLKAITNSRSWKLTQPLRSLRGRHRPQTTPQPISEDAAAAPVTEPVAEPVAAAAAVPAAAPVAEPVAAPVAETAAAPMQASAADDIPFAVSGREAWDKAGLQRLEAFLTSGRRLSFPRAAQPALSIVIVLYNKAHLDLLCLESVLRNADVPYELILVDNHSSDRTHELLDRLDGIEIIRNQENRGFGFACVQGAEQARGEYLLLLNNDALLGAKSLSVALCDFSEDKSIGALGGKILLADGRLQEAGSMVWNDGSAWGYVRGDDPNLPRYNFRRPVDYCSGAFLFTPRPLFQELGGFDERFFPAYYEDTDYCFKVWERGLKVLYEPRAFIHHYESATQESAEAAKAPIAAHQAKFAGKWRERLTHHLIREGASIPYARFAVAADGLRILWMDSFAAIVNGSPESSHLQNTLQQLTAAGHHVTFVGMDASLPGEALKANNIEVVNAIHASHYVFRELLSQYDLVWVRGNRNMQAFLDHLWNMYDRVPPIVYEADQSPS